MSLVSNADTNIVDPRNSFVGSLPPNGSFVGPFVDVTDFTSISFTAIANTPPAALGLLMEWSMDGVTLDSTTIYGSDGLTTQSIHSTIRAKFFRIRYTTGAGGAVGVRLQTLLRKGTITGAVSRMGLVSGAPDAQIVNGITFGKTPTGTYQPVSVIPDVTTPTNFNLAMVPPLNRSNAVATVTVATTVAQPQISFFSNGPSRRWMTVFNNTDRGELFIRLNSAPTITNYDFKVPPQHTWTMPESWVVTGGNWFGTWNFADGECHAVEGS